MKSVMRSRTRSVCLPMCVVSGIESDRGRTWLWCDYAQEDKHWRQCVEAEMEANSTVSTIRRKVVNRANDSILMLHKCIVRPQLEYYIQVVIVINPVRTWKNWRKCEQML